MDYTCINSIPYENLRLKTKYIFTLYMYPNEEMEGILVRNRSKHDIVIRFTKTTKRMYMTGIAYTKTYINNVRPKNKKLDLLYCLCTKFGGVDNLPLTVENIEDIFNLL